MYKRQKEMQLANKATTICREYGRSFYAWKINLSWRALLPFDRLRIWSFFSGSNGCENKQRQRLSQKFHVSLDTKRRTLVASRIWDSLRMLSVVGWILVACWDDLAISLFFVLVQTTILFFHFLIGMFLQFRI